MRHVQHATHLLTCFLAYELTSLPTYSILGRRGVEPYRQSQRLLYRERVSDFQYEPSEDDGADPRAPSSLAPG
mgnify:FL=1